MDKNDIKGALACISAATFFFYSMMQLTVFNSISGDLIKFYGISDVQLGMLSAAFLIANAVFIIPNSVLLDHLDVRKLSLIFLTLCTIPYFLFSLSDNYWLGIVLRFVQGFGGTLALLIGIKIATDWFPEKSATVIGCIVAFGMSGGFFSNLLLPSINDAIGWEKSLWLSGIIGVGFVVFMWFFLKTKNKQQTSSVKFKTVVESGKKLIKSAQLLKAAFFVGLISTPMYIIASLWGNRYLQEAKLFNESQSAFISSLIFLGLIIGSPVVGWFSDFIHSRKVPMIAGALLSLVAIIPIVFMQHLSYYFAAILFFMVGFLISVQSVAYPLIVESTPPEMTSTANGIAFFITNAIGGVGQPLFGYLIGLNLFSNQQGGNYLAGMLIFPIAFVISLVLSFLMKETLRRQ